MKKWMIGSLLLVALMVIAAGVYAQASDKGKKQAKTECTFVDNNKDGKCDVCGSTADKCKIASPGEAGKGCPATTGAMDCAKCPSAASCAESRGTVVPAKDAGAAASCSAVKK